MPTLTPYIRDLLDQPLALCDTLAGLKTQALKPGIPDRLAHGAYRRVVLTGMGSSYHVLHPLHQALVRAGLPAQMVETSGLLYDLSVLLQPDTLVIAVSQSGQSAETVALVERKAARGFSLLGVTNTPNSPLALDSDDSVLTQAGSETTVSCKTYVASLMALAWLAPAVLGQPVDSTLRDLETAAPAVEAYLSTWQPHVEALEQRLAGIREVFVVGRGASLAAAGTGGLIIKEATHLHSEGMSSAAFRHGPYEMLSPEVFVLIFEGAGPAAELNRRLHADVLREGGAAALVSESAPEPVFCLPPLPEIARPIAEILTAEMMTLAIANLKGHEAGKFTRSGKITLTE